ncbi:MAG: DUF885 family protein [Pirellulales bacterium]|nr:DUF885 family protein [Pirellulales bacterium]
MSRKILRAAGLRLAGVGVILMAVVAVGVSGLVTAEQTSRQNKTERRVLQSHRECQLCPASQMAETIDEHSPAAIDPVSEQRSPQQRRRRRQSDGVYKLRIEPHWFSEGEKFWYRNDLAGGKKEFILVDAKAAQRGPAFDHAKLAAALTQALEKEQALDAQQLPFDEIEFTRDEKSVRVQLEGGIWECHLASYECKRIGDIPKDGDDGGRRGRGGRDGQGQGSFAAASDADELARLESAWPDGFYGEFAEPDSLFSAPHLDTEARTAFPQRQGRGRRQGERSPDGKWTAFVRDNNVYVRKNERQGDGDRDNDADSNNQPEEVKLSTDGVDGNAYGTLSWSPDSKTLVAYRVEPGERLQVHFVESSPRGGGRAKLHSRGYALPGDKFSAYELNLFAVEDGEQIKPDVDRVDFKRPRPRWSEDGRSFTYQQIDRGHQRFRVVRVDAATGEAQNIIDDQTETFIWTHIGGWPHVRHLDESNEVIYSSEQDGWRHLYLYDAETGELKNQITQGDWVVRGVDRVDDEKRQIWFRASGTHADQDPYLIHYYRINFDGTGLTALTDGDGTHSISYSPGRKYLVDTYSRADLPPVHELRREEDGELILQLESADVSQLEERGWRPPEVFSAKGRDGETDIWGLIHRPSDFDPQKSYPIIEYIYAGPHDFHVPKAFRASAQFTNLTRLGFIVVQIDGMGTAHRSKAFHDVCWHNLKDAGFPDRILWIKSAAEKYPYMDASRVGIYGTSAGGQNSTGALLFHPEFYKAAVSACGCHDNRMDKASWNEQWMGYPVGPHYAESSNIDNAGKLVGHLMLIVGEMDTNVPPESTLRLVDALIKANKDFDLLVIPGGGHTSGGRYGTRRLEDFFVRYLQGIDPPNRNAPADEQSNQGARRRRGRLQPVSLTTPQQTGAMQNTDAQTQTDRKNQEAETQTDKPETLDLTAFFNAGSEVRAVAERFEADRGNLERFYSVKMSPLRRQRMEQFYGEWLAALKELDQSKLSEEALEDLEALNVRIQDKLTQLSDEAARAATVSPLVNFAPAIVSLAEARQRKEAVDARASAGLLNQVTQHVRKLRTHIEYVATLDTVDEAAEEAAGERGAQAADAVKQLTASLAFWHDFYNAYDPMFTWWVRKPYEELKNELQAYADVLRAAPLEAAVFDVNLIPAFAGNPPPASSLPAIAETTVPNLQAIIDQPRSEMQGVIEQYRSSQRRGRGGLNRGSPRGEGATAQQDRGERLRRWLAGLEELDFEALSRDGKIDYLLLANSLKNDLRTIEDAARIRETVAAFTPFDNAATQLVPRRNRRRRERGDRQRGGEADQQADQSPTIADDETALEIFARLRAVIPETTTAAQAALNVPMGTDGALDASVTTQVVRSVENLQRAMGSWRRARNSRDSEPSSEITSTYDEVHAALAGYAELWQKRSRMAGADDPDGIVGRPIGKAALERELRAEMIAYSPEELIEIAYAELELCHNELRAASQELGYGDDWHRAVEHVKHMHVTPGEQPGMIRDLAWEAIDYLREHDLVTVPAVAAETWRMEMMSPARQLVSPFFLGGETIIVSYPTDGMKHDDKLQSMRGNNIPFARATVQHELIPGHHLQSFMSRRYHPYRKMFDTPFFVEGWALYWELILYERGFPRTPEEKIGMLVWRSHRCARIIFSLSYHMGLMRPQQCIDFLVQNVGFERNNSTAEVRRSFGGGYGPLYQAAYLLGGIQLRELRKELVDSGKMPEKAFHDAILTNSIMPIDMVRASLTEIPLSRDYQTTWRFHPLKP